MKKKKNARITIDVTLGIVFSITLFIAVVWIVAGLVRPTEESKNSFYNLVNLIEKVDGSNPGTIKSMALRMDKNTAIVGFSSDCNQLEFKGMAKSGGWIQTENYLFKKPLDHNCEEDNACICLCRKIDSEYEGGEIKCEEKQLFCETFDGIEFPGCFFISRSPLFLEESYDLQLRTVYVEKYSEYGEDLVAVCENLEEGSCLSQEYREEKKAIYSLNNFKNFIELCKDREFVEDEEPCSCGAFNFKSFIPEGYSIEFSEFTNSESDEESLKLTLMKGKEEKGSIKIDTTFCVYNLKSDGKNSISYPGKSINLEHNIKYDYVFYYGNYFEEENPQIAFIKYNEKNICLAHHELSDKGYIKPYSEPFDTILIKYDDPLGFVDQSTKLMGCGYSATDTEELW